MTLKQEPILNFELETVQDSIMDTEEGVKKLKSIKVIMFKNVDIDNYWENAISWYEKAASQHDTLAERILQSIEEFKTVEEKAFTGDVKAQYLLSIYYHDGYGTYIDLLEASDWLKIAAINGCAEAKESIRLWNGKMNKKQSVTDLDFYAEPYWLPYEYEKLYMLERHGRNLIRFTYRTGLTGLWESIYGLSFKETYMLAENGDKQKQYQLAWLYDWGHGVEQDMEKAIKCFVDSAYNGYAPAQTELGIMYHYGIWAVKNEIKY